MVVLGFAMLGFVVWIVFFSGPPHERVMAQHMRTMQQAPVVLRVRAVPSDGEARYRVAEVWREESLLPLPARPGDELPGLKRDVPAPDGMVLFYVEQGGRLERRFGVEVHEGVVRTEGYDWLPYIVKPDTRLDSFRSFVTQALR